eukprot:6762039-Pyramimonas_sp.AAC.1
MRALSPQVDPIDFLIPGTVALLLSAGIEEVPDSNDVYLSEDVAQTTVRALIRQAYVAPNEALSLQLQHGENDEAMMERVLEALEKDCPNMKEVDMNVAGGATGDLMNPKSLLCALKFDVDDGKSGDIIK